MPLVTLQKIRHEGSGLTVRSFNDTEGNRWYALRDICEALRFNPSLEAGRLQAQAAGVRIDKVSHETRRGERSLLVMNEAGLMLLAHKRRNLDTLRMAGGVKRD